ncbi:filamentous hemagglutinin N-terminal domain-containing protein [Achromobacter kerstersii]|uniref:two-partner secretion domain-containing protein n=1 Tax=Achromobacter kerstersii TaxID=1353890 RepID=UPI0006BED27C|nr:filamentous hemagglutinin N-terminal domain-containing protein [Achromobacter kerstersii]CUI37095.1 Heme:hemopexin utilization protein A [Achromobacter kerstersii]
MNHRRRVSENKADRRERRALRKSIVLLGGVSSCALLLAGSAYAQNLPVGGKITRGQGSISEPNRLSKKIQQTSSKLSIDWNSFHIASGSRVDFQQPDANAIALNRVAGTEGSKIMGQLNANGRVFIINANGVLFGKTAKVNVGGLVASTLNLSNEDLQEGRFRFVGDGRATPAGVINEGVLIAADGGTIALLGGQVENKGVIRAKQGAIALASGQRITLGLSDDGLLNAEIDQAALNALVSNHNALTAQGGQVTLHARASNAVAHAVVNNQGLIEAQTLNGRSGKIVLDGGAQGTVVAAGTLDSSAFSGNAGDITVQGQRVDVRGNLLATAGSQGDGGNVLVQGRQVQMEGSAQADTRAALGNGGWLTLEADQISVTTQEVPLVSGISGEHLSRQLSKNNIALTSTQGDLRVLEETAWDSDTTLSLDAKKSVRLNANVEASGDKAGFVMNHGADADYILGKDVTVTLPGSQASLRINGQDYQLIRNVHELQAIENNLSGAYALANAIDAHETGSWNARAGFRPIGGDYSSSTQKFEGVLTGMGHAVDSLKIKADSSNPTGHVGLFSNSHGVLRNIGLRQLSISVNQPGRHNVAGGLVGVNGGVVKYAYASGEIRTTQSNDSLGGLVGVNYGDVLNSHSRGGVLGVAGGGASVGELGGLVGSNQGRIAHAYSTTVIRAGVSVAGGLVGKNEKNGSIEHAYATGGANGEFYTGGLVGANYGSISNSHATGLIASAYQTGGLVGLNGWTGTITDSRASGHVVARSYFSGVGGLVGENNGIILRGHASGDITGSGDNAVGGLVGRNRGGIIRQSSATGSAIAGSHSPGHPTGSVGGLVGTNASANGRTALIIDSYASGNAVGRDDQDAVGGLVGMNTGVIERSASSGSAYGRGILGSLVGWNLHPDAYRTESEIRQSQGSGTVNGDDGRQVGLDQGKFEW